MGRRCSSPEEQGPSDARFTRRLFEVAEPRAIRILSRDEFKQLEMSRDFEHDSRLRMLIGDVRDVDRLTLAFRGVDVVIHAAALKQVPACEYNPFEAVKTNVLGAENVLRAAIETGVERVVALSTDKAVNPANLYGATKLCAEKVFVQAQYYAADTRTRFACVRYGNVVGSRGSVVPLFLAQARQGVITITDERMTRFWITLDEACDFVISKTIAMNGGEIFVPKLPSMRVTDIATVVAPDAQRDVVGIRPGEKLHEALLTADEARQAVEFDDCYAVLPAGGSGTDNGKSLPEGFEYTSDANDVWIGPQEFEQLLSELQNRGQIDRRGPVAARPGQAG